MCSLSGDEAWLCGQTQRAQKGGGWLAAGKGGIFLPWTTAPAVPVRKRKLMQAPRSGNDSCGETMREGTDENAELLHTFSAP